MSNPIVTENLNTGTTAWKIGTGATTQIQAYANLTSVSPGSSINFCVSTQSAGTTYSINIYRMGWYNGAGARLMQTVPGQTGSAQGYYDLIGQTLHNCPTAVSDSTTHLLEARWTSSYTWNVPSNACTGIYLAQFTDASGNQWYVTFVVLGNTTADYVVVRPFTTDYAYNAWGGYSLYPFNSIGNVAATKVSFDRPNENYYSNFQLYEMPLIRWLEQQGYNLSYISNVDLHVNAAQLTNYNAYLSIGHDEYWSKAMRDGVESALTKGVGLAFCGADASYWQIRFESSGLGVTNQTVVGYKCLTVGGTSDLQRDPQYGVNNAIVTTQWRDPVLNRPENTLLGIMYSHYTNGNNFAWTVNSSATSPYLAGTGLVNGKSYGYDLVGYEWDKNQSGGPSNLQIIGATSTTDENSNPDTSHTTSYIAPSGALVFASGSVSWTWSLDPYRHSAQTGGNPSAIPAMQQFFANIMTALISVKNPQMTNKNLSPFGVYHL